MSLVKKLSLSLFSILILLSLPIEEKECGFENPGELSHFDQKPGGECSTVWEERQTGIILTPYKSFLRMTKA